MKINDKKILICNCENTMQIDKKKLGILCDNKKCDVYSNLCNKELNVVEELLPNETKEDLLIACTQEKHIFENLAEEKNLNIPKTFNIRELSEWSKESKNSLPKTTSLIKHATDPKYSTPSLNLLSHGRCLIYFDADKSEDHIEEILNLSNKISNYLGVTLLITNQKDLILNKNENYQICTGSIEKVEGYFTNFKIKIKNFGELCPSSKTHFKFTNLTDEVDTECDIVINFTDQTIINSAHKRDGFFKCNIKRPQETLELYSKIIEMIGDFEKPLYIKYEDSLCAHSRNKISGCNNCIDVCPASAIISNGDSIEINPGICGGCGLCGAVCPSGAIETDYPPLDFILNDAKKLIEYYKTAGGKNPQILLFDNNYGDEIIAILSRHYDGLPSNLIPFGMHSTGRIGHDLIISLVAIGYEKINILINPKLVSDHIHLKLQKELIESLLGNLNKNNKINYLNIIEEADPEKISQLLYNKKPGLNIKRNSFNPIGKPRSILKVAMKSLHSENKIIELPEGSPYGALEIDTNKCTICLSCVSACPATALQDSPDKPQLSFREDACLQCGICVSTCPEKAIKLKPQYNLNDDAMSAKVIIEDNPFNCISCGKTFGSTKSIEKIISRLSTHSIFQGDKKVEILKMCEDCRVGAMFETNDKLLDIKDRDKPRTTDDYL